MLHLRIEYTGYGRYDLKICDDGILVQILSVWTFSIVLSLFKLSSYVSKLNVSETRFCLRLQVKLIQLGPIDKASPYLWIQSMELVPIFGM
jgi:hypothetical protein